MCDQAFREIEKYRADKDQDYCSINANRDKSQEVGGYVREKISSDWPSALTTWCPRANIYYAYTEDTNVFERVEEFIADKLKNPDNEVNQIHFDPPLDPFTIRDPYEENSAREKYLNAKPVSFAIFGKPGLDTDKLASLISEWWKCALVSPQFLIQDEIDKKSDKGRWIADMLENGESLRSNIVMNLVESRINQRDIMHRGYVVEGLPLIPDKPEIEYSTCPENVSPGTDDDKCCKIDECVVESEAIDSSSQKLLNEKSLDFSVSSSNLLENGNADISTRENLLQLTKNQKTFWDIKGIAGVYNPFGDQNYKILSHEKYDDYIPKQIEAIFKTWPVKPTVIIYVTCPDEDVTERIEHFKFDPLLGKMDTRFYEMGESQFDDDGNKSVLKPMSDSIKFQCEIYKRCALPVIEHQVLGHNPQYVIRIEGRTSVTQMFQTVSTKLSILPLSRAVMPKNIWDFVDAFEGEENEEFKTDEKLNGKIDEETFKELAKKSVISPKFPWTISNWKFTCPVELAKGQRIEGKPEYSVRFMNKIFFLSSMESMNLFLDNPRPFISSMKPRPSCKIAIFGPRYSGKSELSEALGRYFQENFIDVREMIRGLSDEQIEKNIANAMRQAYPRVIEDLRERLESERQEREKARIEAFDLWFDEAKEIIKQLDRFRQTINSEDDEDSAQSEEFTQFREKLYNYGLSIFEKNPQLTELVTQNDSIICDYAPANLRDEELPVRELSEHDPEVMAIVEDQVMHLRDDKIEITNVEIAGSLISRIKMMPEVRVDGELSRESGFIIDGMHPKSEIWRILAEAGVTFSDLILIKEESPYKSLLLNWERFYDAQNQPGESEYEYIEDTEKFEETKNYIAEIREFEEDWQIFNSMLEEQGVHPFICKFDETSNMFEAVKKLITDYYYLEAKIMTDDERKQEFADTIESVTDLYDEDDEDEDDAEQLDDVEKSEVKDVEVKDDDRRLGDTGIYCPVALARKNVLWKGKDEYSALYLDKIYLCSGAKALENFVKNPESFNVPFKKPMLEIPPARICIVGPPGSGKSTLAKMLSVEYSMTHVDFFNNLDWYMCERGIIPLDRNEDEEEAENVELPSDPADIKYNNDRDTLLAFLRKYKKEGATIPNKMLNECFLKFFDSPYNTSIVIFDSFPNCLEDAEAAMDNYAVPELVIELECSLDVAQSRLLPKLLENRMKKQEINRNDDEYDENEGEENEEYVEKEEEKEDSIDEEEVREEILRHIEEIYERKKEMLEKARTRMREESISWITINSDMGVEVMMTNLQKIIDSYMHRESSTFERTYQIDPYKADDLLDHGYYFLSSFGRSCPVQMYDKTNPFQMYLPMDERGEIFPILHRQYVYFIAGDEACKMFRKDPLKYLLKDSCDPVLPARISIVGPPKSGKSTLAERFARVYGMRSINRESALGWTRKNCSWTRTGTKIEELLGAGKNVPSELLARAVELYSSDYRTSTQGYILDGFPISREETEQLALLNIRPMIVINLQADQDFCLSSTAPNDDKVVNDPKDQSVNLIAEMYDEWQRLSRGFFDWLNKYSQNLVNINATGSKWLVWRQANRQVSSIFTEIKHYFREADYEKVHSLRSLGVTPYEFKNRQSNFESYCPVCLHHENVTRFSGSPPDRCGVVQFRLYFYWVCAEHIMDFHRNPLTCLPPQSSATLPKLRPQILNDEIDIEHACWAKRLMADGYCIVSYADALPEYSVVPGKRNIGVLYEDKLFLFCSLDCREEFLLRSSWYSKIVIDLSRATSSMALKNLTNLEYLEETVAEELIQSLIAVAAKRPKYPGASASISAAIYIGIHLKIHNDYCAIDEIKVYEEVRKRLEARWQIIKIATRNIKKMINPHVTLSM